MNEQITLEPLRLGHILENWRPGSQGPRWTWDDEEQDLLTRDRDRMTQLNIAIIQFGWDLPGAAPIKLGWDGRVWNGHHRLVIARSRGNMDLVLNCEVVNKVERRY